MVVTVNVERRDGYKYDRGRAYFTARNGEEAFVKYLMDDGVVEQVRYAENTESFDL